MSLVIGLTGGIASGKSTVSNMLKELGITVIDADIEARLAVEKGEPAYKKIIGAFGNEILEIDGNLNRQKLGSIIFHDEEKRSMLNQIVHPEVRKRMTKQKENAISRGEKIVIMDIPLLFESKLTSMVDKTLLIYVDQATQLRRLMERNHFSEAEAMARIKSQVSLQEKMKWADEIINNNGDLSKTFKQLIHILNKWGWQSERGD